MIVDLFAPTSPSPAATLPLGRCWTSQDGKLVKVLVTVTKEDIAEGTHACTRCPIALALRRALPGAYQVYVRHDSIVIAPRDTLLATYELPDPVADFVNRFDAMDTVAPFSFEIEVPECLTKGGAA